MEPIKPVRTTTNVAKGNVFLFLVSLITVVVGLTSATKTPTWIMLMSIGGLLFGWLVVASLIAFASSESGIVCPPPSILRELHAMTGTSVSVRLQNPGSRWPLLFVTAELTVACDGQLLKSPPKLVGQLPIRSEAEFTWKVIPRKRGRLELRGLGVRTSFPGSLLSHEHYFAFDCLVNVLPAVYRLKPQVNQILAGRRHASEHRPSNPAAMEEFVGVRTYRPGDNPRNVCLAHSLRMPDFPWQLVVREFEDSSDEEVCIVLDTYVPHDDRDLGEYRLEKAICFAIALCRDLTGLKHRVRFMAHGAGGVVEVHIRRPLNDIPTIERKLAVIEPTTDPQACQRLLLNQERKSDAVLVCIGLDSRRAVGSDFVLYVDPSWQASLVAEVAA